MNDLKIFENSEFGKIQVIERNGEPWFIGKDVAEILGYTNPRKALNDHVDDDDKLIFKSNETVLLDFAVPNRGLTIINESGLYSLVLSSKLEKAKAFKRWVTNEVIPATKKFEGWTIDE